MFPDEVFLTLCCPKAEITEAYSIGETAINIPALEGAPIPIEIELTSTSLIGDLKDRLNIILGEKRHTNLHLRAHEISPGARRSCPTGTHRDDCYPGTLAALGYETPRA